MAEVASAFVSLMPSARGFGSKLDSQISPEIDKSGKKGGLSFGKLFAAGAALGIGAKAFSFLGDSLAEATDAAVVGSRTENVIAKMGNAANISAGQVATLAGAISAKTGIDDEAIQSGQNLLLTFGNVANQAGKGNDIFNQTSKLMVDMSAAMGTDAKSAALQLGKALNDPTKGVTALTRSGVSFTQQQKDQIAAMQATGNVLGAQKIILGEVQKQFGGAGAAMTTPAEKAKVAWGNLQEQFGTMILPAFNAVATVISTKIVPAIASFLAGVQNGTGAGGRFAAVFGTIASVLGRVTSFVIQNKAAVGTFVGIIGTVIAVTKAWRAAQLALNFILSANPIGIVIVAIAALAAGLVFAYKKSTTFRNIVDGAFSAVKAAAASVASFFTTKVPAAFNTVKAAASTALGWVKSNWPVILAVLTGPFGLAALAIVKNWDKIKAGGQAVLEFIKGMPGKILGFFSNAGTLLLSVGNQIIDGLTAGIRAAAGRVMSAVDAVINAIPAKIRKLMGIASPSKVTTVIGQQIMDGLKMGFDKNGKKVVERLKAHVEKIKGTFDTLKSDMASLSDAVSSAFNPDMFGVLGKAADDLGPATTALQEFMGGLSGNNANLTTMLAAFDQLKAAGASTAFLNGLFQSGNTALATQLATAGPAAVQQASALFDANATLATQLGSKVATDEYGAQIASEMKVLTKAMDDAPKKYAKEIEPLLKNLGRAIGYEINSVAAKASRNASSGRGAR